MNPILSAALLPCSVVALVFALSPEGAQPAATGSDEEIIRHLESEWASALVRTDFAAIDRITAPEWVLTTPDGKQLPKAQADADLKAGALRFESLNVDTLQIRIYGGTAVVFGLETQRSTHLGNDVSGQYRFTDVFVKRDGRWQCVATQLTRIASPSL
ncbi:MAG TPA: nuclear transport factor 2 family protein [Opitutaceae bacterium]